MEQLILNGKTSKIVGFLNPDGSKSDGKLAFDRGFKIVLSK